MAKKALIVDDNQQDLNTMARILKSSKYEATTAENGVEAVDALRDKSFDVILLDIRMPTLSGYDLLRLLRERIDGDTNIVYVSVVPKKDVDLSSVDGFVQKPFSPEALLKAVEK